MNEITDIWFKTNMSLETLTKKLDFELEVYDYENVWEWKISSFEDFISIFSLRFSSRVSLILSLMVLSVFVMYFDNNKAKTTAIISIKTYV